MAEPQPPSMGQLTDEYQRYREMWNSPPYSDNLTQLFTNPAFLSLPAAITQAIYCGLGHFAKPAISSSNTNSALHQLVIFERILGYLREGGRTISEVYFQRSEFSEVENEFLRSRGYTVLVGLVPLAQVRAW